MPRETAAERAERERLAPPEGWQDQNVHMALLNVMRELPAVGKESQNTESPDQFWFRGIDAIVNAVGPLFRKHGVLCLPKVLKADIRPASTDRGAGMVAWVRMRYTFWGPDGSKRKVTVAGEAMDTGDKALSKAQSVAWRVALIQALSIPTGERDPDASTYRRTGEQPASGGDGTRKRGEQQRSGPADPRQEWWDAIGRKAKGLNMTVNDVRRDFARWSGGKEIDGRATTVEMLVRYCEELVGRPNEPQQDEPPPPDEPAHPHETEEERAARMLREGLGAQPAAEAATSDGEQPA